MFLLVPRRDVGVSTDLRTSVAAVKSCYFSLIVAAVIGLVLGTLFLLFAVLLNS